MRARAPDPGPLGAAAGCKALRACVHAPRCAQSEKGTKGIDGRVVSNKGTKGYTGKGQRAFVITLGRAGEDNKSFRLADLDQTFQGFASADYDLQDALAAADNVTQSQREVDGLTFYDYDIDSPVRGRQPTWQPPAPALPRPTAPFLKPLLTVRSHTLCTRTGRRRPPATWPPSASSMARCTRSLSSRPQRCGPAVLRGLTMLWAPATGARGGTCAHTPAHPACLQEFKANEGQMRHIIETFKLIDTGY